MTVEDMVKEYQQGGSSELLGMIWARVEWLLTSIARTEFNDVPGYDPEDLVQECYEAFERSVDTFNGRRFETYLRVNARRAMIDIARKARAKRRYSDTESIEAMCEDGMDRCFSVDPVANDNVEFEQMLGTLGFSDVQMVIIHGLIEGKVRADICKELGVKAPTMNYHIKRISEKLSFAGIC